MHSAPPTTPLVFLLVVSSIVASSSFLLHHHVLPPYASSSSHSSSLLLAAPATNVHVLPDESDVIGAIHRIVENAANDAISSRGHFALAIPGGSILKVLSSLEPGGDWPTRTTLAFVNHKCVPIGDVSRAIEAQARSKFVNRWRVGNVVSLAGTEDGESEASGYEAKLRGLSEDVLPRDVDDGFPIFDLALIGVGDDGHVGSLYPNRDEINVLDGPWVVAAHQKSPPSISLTLPVMRKARLTVIVASGKSDKYPNGKAGAMRLAISDEDVTPDIFPAMALREYAMWILDDANGSELGTTKTTLGTSTVEDAVAGAMAMGSKAKIPSSGSA
ncbi:hypothetical protein ACHAW5_009029 [Stephanodiscus triporus]|uniref:Glucosamine/galactosamine-6-phosphate isomerase domain-containing protein n=1 Tax=Stephanodiscus triporus TaxID=2934178 RepID=A0ABD3QKS1_9STRA